MDKKFTQGLIYKAPRENSPDFVLGSLSVKVSEFVEFITANQKNGWVNIDLLKSKQGKLYSALNEFEPKAVEQQMESNTQEAPKEEELKDSQIPF